MFSKLTVYRIAAGLPGTAEQLGQYLMRTEFQPTAANQAKASGFVAPRAAHGAFAESVAGHWIARVMIETRKVPGDALQRRIDEIVDEFEKLNGRTPGRKQRAEIKEAAVDELLPQAFPKQAAVPVWVDPTSGLLAIGSTSSAHVDEVITLLVRAIPDFALARVVTRLSPAAAMTGLLIEGAADDFTIGRDCVLEATDESKAVVKYQRQDLGRDDVRDHLRAGKVPTSLSLTWRSRVSFTLADSMQLKRVEMLDVVFEGRQADEDTFDADVTIACGELAQLISDLIYMLGGELEEQALAPTGSDTTAVAWDDGESDPMIDRARALVVSHEKASISFVQRHLQIGYNRAARLLESLEREGVVSRMASDGTREIITK